METVTVGLLVVEGRMVVTQGWEEMWRVAMGKGWIKGSNLVRSEQEVLVFYGVQ